MRDNIGISDARTGARRASRAMAALAVTALAVFATASIVQIPAAGPAFAAPGHAAEPPLRVLVLEGLTPGQAGSSETITAFRQRLQARSARPVEIHSDFLDLGRFNGPEAEARLVRFLRAKYARKKPDIVFPISRSALTFLVHHRQEFAAGIPAVHCCTPSSITRNLDIPPDLPGVVVGYDWKGTFELARRLQPDARRLVIVSGDSPVGHAFLEDAIAQIGPDLKQYEVTYITSSREEERLRQVSGLPRATILMLMPIFGEGLSGKGPSELAAILAKASPAPAYSPVPTLLGMGIVGGSMDNYAAQGWAAADLAVQVLSGQDPSTLSRETKLPLHIRVDAGQLARWGTPERALPGGASVELRPENFWVRHRVALATAILAAALLAEMARRHVGALRLLRVSRAQEESSRRSAERATRLLAHEVRQPLSAIALEVAAAREYLGRSPPVLSEVRESLKAIAGDVTQASEVIASIREAVDRDRHQMGAVDLNRVVAEALDEMDDAFKTHGVRIVLSPQPGLPPVRGSRRQLVQALCNVLRNAAEAMDGVTGREKLVRIQTALQDADRAAVTIEDSGPGIDPNIAGEMFEFFRTTKPSGMGLGLALTRMIVEQHGGEVMAFSPAGAKIRIVLPVA